MLDANMSLEEMREFFGHDHFAHTMVGCRIMQGAPGYAVCELNITPYHRNAMGQVMGGAIFTLADYALAVACNLGQEGTVNLASSIEFMSAVKGEKLIATCTENKRGRHASFYTVEVRDDKNTQVARFVATCYQAS